MSEVQHDESINGIPGDNLTGQRFLDGRLVASCSDDASVAIWDVRYMANTPVRRLKGHSSWVKNIEYVKEKQILVSSGFDGAIFAWDLNRPESDSTPAYDLVFTTPGLMRMRLSPQADKMILSTQWGYLLVFHNLDLDNLRKDTQLFKPNLYWLTLKSGATFSTYYNHLSLFTPGRRNQAEIILDFPVENDPENITSLAVHPQGWAVLSRSTNHEESHQWTCLHDIQWPPASDLCADPDDVQERDVGSTSMTLTDVDANDVPFPVLPLPNQIVQVTPPTNRTEPSETRVEVFSAQGSRYRYVSGQCRTRRDNFIAVNLPRQGEEAADNQPSTSGASQPGETRSAPAGGPIRSSLSRRAVRAAGRQRVNDTRMSPYLQVRVSNEDFNAQFSISGETSVSQPRTFFIRTGPRSTGLPVVPGESNESGSLPNIQFASRRTEAPGRTIVLLGGEQTGDTWCSLSGRVLPGGRQGSSPFVTLCGPLKHTPVYRRLMYNIEDSHVCRGFIKEQAFSPDGRLIVSPFAHGFRLLAYNADLDELQDTEVARSHLETPKTFAEPATLFKHKSPVLCAKFSPTMPLIATGCIAGKVVFSMPRFG